MTQIAFIISLFTFYLQKGENVTAVQRAGYYQEIDHTKKGCQLGIRKGKHKLRKQFNWQELFIRVFIDAVAMQICHSQPLFSSK